MKPIGEKALMDTSSLPITPAVDRTTHPAFGKFPAKLFVETTSRCNLECFMCVKQTQDHGVCDGDLARETLAALSPAFPHLEALILNGIGEPLLHPQLEEFIAEAKKSLPQTGWIGFQSNGLLLNAPRARSLVAAGLDKICLSVDAASPELFRKMREGGDLGAVAQALAHLAAAQKEIPGASLATGVEFVLMRDNLLELPRAIDWAGERGVSFVLVTHMLPYDEAHADQAVYPTMTAEAVELFRKWRAVAQREGLDISRYFKSLIRYTDSRSEKEQRLYKLVEQMKAEALAQGIVLDLRGLMQLDESHLEQVGEIFARSREAADRWGLELRLPEIMPRHRRKCEFVEDAGAFISWDGKVHPCYFLWHRFNCFAMGWQQQVKPKVFGDLAQQTIGDIWNGPDFRAFREEALGYAHPFCSNCSVAPCDLVQTDRFEHDCHVQAQPCGSCLWCMGLFQCLR